MSSQLSDATIRTMIIGVLTVVVVATIELTLIAIIRDGSTLTSAVNTLTGLVNDVLLVSGPIVGHMVTTRGPNPTKGNGGSGAGPSVPTP